MGLFGIGDDNRMILDVPVRYAPVLGLPYDPDDDSVWEKSDKKINIVVSKGKGVAKAEGDAIRAYRNYYIREKSYMARWKFTEEPVWYTLGMAAEDIVDVVRLELSKSLKTLRAA